MSITKAEIKFYKSSTGVGIGGIPDTTSEIINNTSQNIFDNISAAKAKIGDTEYRLIYVKNENSSITLKSTRAFIEANTPSANDTISIGKTVAAINNPETAITNENTAPDNVAFSSPTNLASGIVLGNIPAEQYAGIWIQRIVDPNAVSYTDNTFTIRVQGETS